MLWKEGYAKWKWQWNRKSERKQKEKERNKLTSSTHNACYQRDFRCKGKTNLINSGHRESLLLGLYNHPVDICA